jgi:prepilin-type N-terminal cleavage/methylation domain-containing protein
MKRFNGKTNAGFTLVEIIITLLVAVILGAVMMQYLGSAVSQSSTPMKRLLAGAALQAVADNIIGAFRQTAPSNSAAWNDFQSGIGTAGTDQNNAYGEYRVLYNDFIQFNTAGNEISDVYGTAPEDILKVVIAEASNDPLTFLLIR